MIIITRHPALVTFLAELGFTGQVVEHATPEVVTGQHVVGILPLHLAALAAKVTVPTLEVPQTKRGQELTLEEVKQHFKGLETFIVTKE